jgi:hypothetical protein
MTRSKLTAIATAALIGAAFCAAPMQSASAFTLNSPSLAASAAGGQVDKVQWRHGGWRGGGWRRGGGWVPGAIIGGLALGALGAGYYGGYYGPYGYGYGPGYGPGYGDCWRDGWGRVRCY